MSGVGVLKRAYGVSVMACVSACEELKRGRTQMGDRCGKPYAPYKVIVATTLASQDVACEARSAFCEALARASVWRESGAETLHVWAKKTSQTVKL